MDAMVVEAVFLKVIQEDKEARKAQEREEWKKDHHKMRQESG